MYYNPGLPKCAPNCGTPPPPGTARKAVAGVSGSAAYFAAAMQPRMIKGLGFSVPGVPN